MVGPVGNAHPLIRDEEGGGCADKGGLPLGFQDELGLS